MSTFSKKSSFKKSLRIVLKYHLNPVSYIPSALEKQHV